MAWNSPFQSLPLSLESLIGSSASSSLRTFLWWNLFRTFFFLVASSKGLIVGTVIQCLCVLHIPDIIFIWAIRIMRSLFLWLCSLFSTTACDWRLSSSWRMSDWIFGQIQIETHWLWILFWFCPYVAFSCVSIVIHFHATVPLTTSGVTKKGWLRFFLKTSTRKVQVHLSCLNTKWTCLLEHNLSILQIKLAGGNARPKCRNIPDAENVRATTTNSLFYFAHSTRVRVIVVSSVSTSQNVFVSVVAPPPLLFLSREAAPVNEVPQEIKVKEPYKHLHPELLEWHDEFFSSSFLNMIRSKEPIFSDLWREDAIGELNHLSFFVIFDSF